MFHCQKSKPPSKHTSQMDQINSDQMEFNRPAHTHTHTLLHIPRNVPAFHSLLVISTLSEKRSQVVACMHLFLNIHADTQLNYGRVRVEHKSKASSWWVKLKRPWHGQTTPYDITSSIVNHSVGYLNMRASFEHVFLVSELYDLLKVLERPLGSTSDQRRLQLREGVRSGAALCWTLGCTAYCRSTPSVLTSEQLYVISFHISVLSLMWMLLPNGILDKSVNIYINWIEKYRYRQKCMFCMTCLKITLIPEDRKVID